MAEIKKHIKQGTTIYSDSWRAYKTKDLEKAGFKHFNVNHKYNFVDPDTGANTQTVERLWDYYYKFKCGRDNEQVPRFQCVTRGIAVLHVIIWSHTWLSSCGASILPEKTSLKLCWKQLQRPGLQNHKCNSWLLNKIVIKSL